MEPAGVYWRRVVGVSGDSPEPGFAAGGGPGRFCPLQPGESQGLHSGVAGRRSQPGGHLGSQAQQFLPSHSHQRGRHSDFGAASQAGQADGQAGRRPLHQVLRQRPSPGGALLRHRTPAQPRHAVPGLGVDRGQGAGAAEQHAALRDCALAGRRAPSTRTTSSRPSWVRTMRP